MFVLDVDEFDNAEYGANEQDEKGQSLQVEDVLVAFLLFEDRTQLAGLYVPCTHALL